MIVMKLKYLIYLTTSINLVVIVMKLYGLFMRDIEKQKKQIDTPDSLEQNTHAMKRRGRPKCFNEQDALEQAMLLFWKYGYEATSISDLTQALGITAPSLYSSFGGKKQLFEKCLEYYSEYEGCTIGEFFDQSKDIKISLELYLLESAKKLIQSNKPTGCMFVVATMNCSEQNQELQQQMLDKRYASKQQLKEYLNQAQEEGQISIEVDVQCLTDFYSTILHGMTMQARDGASLSQLKQVVKMSMQAWDLYIIKL